MLDARRGAPAGSRDRFAWWILAAAAWVVGQLFWDLYSIIGFPASPNPADLGWYGFWSVMIFLGVLTIGFIYEWRKGALEWD